MARELKRDKGQGCGMLPLYFLACMCYHSEWRWLCSGRIAPQATCQCSEPRTSGLQPLVFSFWRWWRSSSCPSHFFFSWRGGNEL